MWYDDPMSQAHATTAIDRLLEPVGRLMTPDLARELVELRASSDVQARIDELAEKCNEGALTAEERSEYEGLVQAIHMIGLLQGKARGVLETGSHP
jgi:hypothetical protein